MNAVNNKLFAAVLAFAGFAAQAEVIECDVAVVGGGSAGFAAALASAEKGRSTVLVEKEAILGGTSTIGGVSNWEPGVGADGVPQRVFERLAAIPGACGIWYQKYHSSYGDVFPGAFLEIDPDLSYDCTARRYGPSMGSDRAAWLARYHGVIFEPLRLAEVMKAMLEETGRCRVMLSAGYESCVTANGLITELHLSNGDVIRPKAVVDACGFVALDAGCGSETSENPNGVSLIFRVTSDPDAAEIPVPGDTPDTCSWAKSFPVVWCARFPCGDLLVNMLPTMSGEEAVELGAAESYAECRRRVFAQWKWMKATYPQHFGAFKIKEISSRLAYRETHRIVCEHMLTGAEVKAGAHFPDEIALADHAFDSHGGTGGYSGELDRPYGIPLRSLMPLGGPGNLYVAGRIAGFDVDAATSCRLSRTMMKLGEAAGCAAADVSQGVVPAPLARYQALQGVTDYDKTLKLSQSAYDAIDLTVRSGGLSALAAPYLVWGKTDCGGDIAAWEHSVRIADAVGSEGGAFSVGASENGISRGDVVRALAFDCARQYEYLTIGNYAIPLNENATTDRQYDFRFVIPSAYAECALFGGLTRGSPNRIFQLYFTGGKLAVWFGDATKYDMFTPVVGTTYDVRVVIKDGEQKAYWKTADAAEYTLGAEASLETMGYTGPLAVLARYDGASIGSGAPNVGLLEMKETVVSTGEVLRDIIAAKYANQDAAYDRVHSVNLQINVNLCGEYLGAAPYFGGLKAVSEMMVLPDPVVDDSVLSLSVGCNGRVTVTVPPDALTGDSALYLAWGRSDRGGDIVNWDHSLLLSNAVGSAGGEFSVSGKKLGITYRDFVRAILVGRLQRLSYVCPKTNSGWIDLQEVAVSDRQYDFRFFTTGGSYGAFFGGLTRGSPNRIFQLYFLWGELAVWLGDATQCTLFRSDAGTTYDVRLVIKDGEQKAYWKTADAAEYTLGAEASLATMDYTGALALFARVADGNFSYDLNNSVSLIEMKETVVSTGELLKDIAPVAFRDGSNHIYDFVSETSYGNGAEHYTFATEYAEQGRVKIRYADVPYMTESGKGRSGLGLAVLLK